MSFVDGRERALELVFMTLTEYALRRGVSLPTVKREIKRGEGPKITQLSPRRVGIRLDHYREDCDRRVRQPVKPPSGDGSSSPRQPRRRRRRTQQLEMVE
jgi:hypothetical protein